MEALVINPRSFCLAVLLLALTPAAALAAGSVTHGSITVSDAWARPTIGTSTQGVIYLSISNNGTAADLLTGANTPAAQTTELHTMSMSGSMMQMRAVPSFAIGPGKTIAFSPGGDHIMLEGVKAPLKAGDTIDLTLHFQAAGDVLVPVPVKNGE